MKYFVLALFALGAIATVNGDIKCYQCSSFISGSECARRNGGKEISCSTANCGIYEFKNDSYYFLEKNCASSKELFCAGSRNTDDCKVCDEELCNLSAGAGDLAPSRGAVALLMAVIASFVYGIAK